MREQIRKSAIEIAGIILAIAAMWYALEIFTFSSLSEPDAKWWLRASEIMLFISAALLAVGLWGEWPEDESWKKRYVYKAAKGAVIIGVLGELMGDGGVFETSARLQTIEESNIAVIRERAAKLENDAAWRTLTKNQVSILTEALRGHPISLELITFRENAEAFNFCDNILFTLQNIGLNANSGIKQCFTILQRGVGLKYQRILNVQKRFCWLKRSALRICRLR